jgi:hypothetical protein
MKLFTDLTKSINDILDGSNLIEVSEFIRLIQVSSSLLDILLRVRMSGSVNSLLEDDRVSNVCIMRSQKQHIIDNSLPSVRGRRWRLERSRMKSRDRVDIGVRISITNTI